MKTFKKYFYSWIEKNFLQGCSSYNSLATRKSCRSKKQAREMFARHYIPHAAGEIFYWPFSVFKFVRKHGFPVVIKPNVSGFSRGSHFPLTSYGELVKAALMVKIWWPSSVIEQYLRGKNYRVTVIPGEIMSAIRRYPPFVVGDGKANIGELIDRENRVREQMGLYPVIHPLEKSRSVARFLRKGGRTFATVPEKEEYIELSSKIALAPGGVVETLDKRMIHPDNIELFLRLPPLLGANILGIDAIFERGIEYSHRRQRVFFLEVNSRPYLKMHHYPRFGRKEDLSDYYAFLDGIEIEEKDIF